MTDNRLPDPLVPAEVDLRGLEYMPLLGARLFASDFDLEATDAEFRAGLRLWWASWNQVPAASLPTSDRALCQLAGCGDNAAKWRKVKARALHGFDLCSDGRLYHAILADQALIAWEKRAESQAKKNNEAERKRRERDARAAMFDQLRGAGVTPPWNTSTADLRNLVTLHVRVTGAPPVTRTGTAKTGRDVTGRDERTEGEDAPGASREPTPAGAVGRALRQAGIARVNTAHPSLLALLEAGATVDEFVAAVPATEGKADPFAYLLGVVIGRRRDAVTATNGMHRGALPNKQQAVEARNRAVADEWLAQQEGASSP
jgi:uncharacterized protein YdaU (DUF1376 family)